MGPHYCKGNGVVDNHCPEELTIYTEKTWGEIYKLNDGQPSLLQCNSIPLFSASNNKSQIEPGTSLTVPSSGQSFLFFSLIYCTQRPGYSGTQQMHYTSIFLVASTVSIK